MKESCPKCESKNVWVFTNNDGVRMIKCENCEALIELNTVLILDTKNK